jgi:hypothetical protein
MLLRDNQFPFRDINPDEVAMIRQIWGRPQADPVVVRSFLEIGGRPTLSEDSSLMRYMGKAMHETTVATAINKDQGRSAFTHGALLYASVFRYLNPQAVLPIIPDAINTVGNREIADFIMDSRDVIADTMQLFGQLLPAMQPDLERSSRLAEVAQIGAGAIHLVLLETNRQRTSLAAFETDPDMQDLAELFKELE